MKHDIFAQLALPVRPVEDVDGAVIQFAEMTEDETATLGEPFFGGYADDFLADFGLDAVETAPEDMAVKSRRIQG